MQTLDVTADSNFDTETYLNSLLTEMKKCTKGKKWRKKNS
jgi:hypothetical protein